MEDTIILDGYLSKLEIDNSRGSTKHCTLTSNRTENKTVTILMSVTDQHCEIAGIELTSDQRKMLLKFLKQKDR